jgi:aerobic carbon-monoxide dehydrogenase large subunit
METAVSILGSRVVRTEDPRLLTEGGVYLDDVRVPELAGAARVTFVRSPLAHARITGIDAAAARREPGGAGGAVRRHRFQRGGLGRGREL